MLLVWIKPLWRQEQCVCCRFGCVPVVIANIASEFVRQNIATTHCVSNFKTSPVVQPTNLVPLPVARNVAVSSISFATALVHVRTWTTIKTTPRQKTDPFLSCLTFGFEIPRLNNVCKARLPVREMQRHL